MQQEPPDSNNHLAQLLKVYENGLKEVSPKEPVPRSLVALGFAACGGCGLLAWAKAGWLPCLSLVVTIFLLGVLILLWGKYANNKSNWQKSPPES